MPLEAPLPSSAQLKLQQLREQIDQALQSLVADMLALSSAEREAAVSEARTAAQQEQEAALQTVRQQCEAAVADRVAAATATTAPAPEQAALAERLAAAESETAAARAALAAACAERDEALQLTAASKTEAATQLAEARAEAEARLAEARAEATAERGRAEQAQSELTDARARAEQALADAAAERTRGEQALAEAKSQADAKVVDAQAEAVATIAEARAEADRQLADATKKLRDETAAAAAALEQTRVSDRECEMECIERIGDGLRALDAASTLSSTLDTLADHVAAHVARVAVLVIRDAGLRMWTSAGFGEEILQAPSIVVRLDGETVVARAARSGERATTGDGTAEPALEPLPFASLPADRTGLAVPVRVGGRTVGVVYADEGSAGQRTVPNAWPEIVEILTRHAGVCLEVLTLTGAYALHAHRAGSTAQKAAASAPTPPLDVQTGGAPPDAGDGAALPSQAADEDASAIRYARLLISEIKLYHEDAVTEGREEGDLLARLGPEIARARRLYEERVPPEVRSRADHFGQELIRTLANGDPRLLGQVT